MITAENASIFKTSLRTLIKYHLLDFNIFDDFMFILLYSQWRNFPKLWVREPVQISSFFLKLLDIGKSEGWTAIVIRRTRLWNYVELFWNSLDNAPSSIVFYLEIKVEVEVGVHDIRPRFTLRKKAFDIHFFFFIRGRIDYCGHQRLRKPIYPFNHSSLCVFFISPYPFLYTIEFEIVFNKYIINDRNNKQQQ